MAQLHRKLRDGLLIALGVLSFGAYWNFGSFHFGNYIHIWDTFHYYVGSKYFKELSYDRLYECVAVADSEAPGLRRRVCLDRGRVQCRPSPGRAGFAPPLQHQGQPVAPDRQGVRAGTGRQP